ncbi:MAG TPA: alpha/beta fold hydrolase, partial [Thermoanaerobaculia bacterium]|nr:alpha/beta fold hydrolase [Thermoanaerobaculia bacterium]
MTALATLAMSAALAVQPVSIRSADSLDIAGRYLAGGHAAPAVLLLHQCDRKSVETGYERLAAALAERGIHVLEIDFRGFGGSRNETFSDFHRQMDESTPHFPSDTEAAFQWLAKREEVDRRRIAVVAASCGATQAVLLAAKHEVAAMVYLSASLWRTAREQLAAIADVPLLAIYAA